MPGQRANEATRREQILRAAYEVALRRGVDGLTLRAVAAKARLSHGLVLFHFKRKEQLGLALLDRVLETTVYLKIPDHVNAIATPRGRLVAFFAYEMQRLLEDPRRFRLLLEYWARGAHNAVIRAKISSGLNDYRDGFRVLAQEALPGESGGFGTPDSTAAAALSLIVGYAVQSIVDPEHCEIDEYMAVVQALFGRLPKAA
jgi:TetR/AcrR family transcriptional repressor of bet genes